MPTCGAEQFINRDRLRCVYFALLAFKLQIVTLAERLVQNKEATTIVSLDLTFCHSGRRS